jgi:hypothetical protein
MNLVDNYLKLKESKSIKQREFKIINFFISLILSLILFFISYLLYYMIMLLFLLVLYI